MYILTESSKKKKKNKKKKKKSKNATADSSTHSAAKPDTSLVQTDPPSIPVSKFYPNGIYPEGEMHEYKNE
jgi:methionyl aminopeptidase